MSNRRKRKLDRKRARRLDRQARLLEQEMKRERETHPEGDGSPRLLDLHGEHSEVVDSLKLVTEVHYTDEWDDYDPSHVPSWKVQQTRRKDREIKSRRAKKQEMFDEALGL